MSKHVEMIIDYVTDGTDFQYNDNHGVRIEGGCMDRLFILQKSYVEDKFNPDGTNILHMLKVFARRYFDEYSVMDDTCFAECLTERIDPVVQKAEAGGQKIIPVGDLKFVGEGLKYISGNPNFRMKPIEIPNIFWHRRFLCRDYEILPGKDIPKEKIGNGREWFIKDASELKCWNNLLIDGDSTPYIDEKKIYAVSNRIKILSEYRIFVFRDEVVGIMNYDGDPLLLPDVDYVKTVTNMYHKISHPKSYAMDVAEMAFANGKFRTTTLLEIHPFVSCGLYGLYDRRVLNMLEDGVNWYLESEKSTEREEREC